MSDNESDTNRRTTRRKALQLIAGTAAAAGFAGSVSARSSLTYSSNEASTRVDTDDLYTGVLRGVGDELLTAAEIEETRTSVIEEYTDSEGTLPESGLKRLDPDDGLAIAGYNLVVTPDGIVKESFVEVDETSPKSASGRLDSMTSGESAVMARSTGAETVNDGHVETHTRLDKADELLADDLESAKRESGNVASPRTTARTTSLNDDFPEFDDWSQVGQVTSWSEYPPYGDVKRMYTVRRAPIDQQDNGPTIYGVHAAARMNSGRNLCENGESDYCISWYEDPYRRRWRNKEARLTVDWYDGDNIGSESVYPDNEIVDGSMVGESFSVDLGAGAGGGSTAGFSVSTGYEYSESANRIVNASSTRLGLVSHRMELSPSTPAAKETAKFESYSVGRRDTSCDGQQDYCTFTVEPTWDRRNVFWSAWLAGGAEEKEITDTIGMFCL